MRIVSFLMQISLQFIYNGLNKYKPGMVQKMAWRTGDKPLSETISAYPNSKVREANMGPTWVLSAPDGPHVGPMNLAIRVVYRLIYASLGLDELEWSYNPHSK